jgi:hypothetical protein
LFARKYPLAVLWTEVEIARERVNGRIATEAVMIHQAAVAVLSPKGKGLTAFNKTLRKLRNGR